MGTYLSRKTKKAYFSNLNQKRCRSENVLISTVFRIDHAVLKKLIIGKDKLMTDEMQMADICI